MICNALYIKQCYGGFNVYITQIPLCLKQHVYPALMLIVVLMCLWLLTPLAPQIIHLPPSKPEKNQFATIYPWRFISI